MNLLQKAGRAFQRLAVGSALCIFKMLARIILAVVSTVRLIGSELWEIVQFAGSLVKWLVREFTESFRSRVKLSNELSREIRLAKKEGGAAYRSALIKFVVSFVLGENGLLYTGFNYLLPVVCTVFLIGVVKYGSGLEYGLAVEYNGRELGIISAEADFEAAQRDAQQRIAFSGERETIDMSAKFSLRIISDSDEFMTAGQLADEMLAASDEELIEAYGIYIDGRFVGAVNRKDGVEDALYERLLNYSVDGIVRDVDYVNKVEYTQGIYLRSSLMKQQEAIDMLTSTKKQKHVYVAQDGDSALSIIQKYGMQMDEFEEMNPNLSMGVKAGQLINVTKTESFLPIKYVREIESHSFLPYEVVEVETSALNVGNRAVLNKGERGEKISNIEITYIDGIESSRKVTGNKVLKNPVVETIGVGTYSAMPDDPATVFFGRPMTGSGQMGWPLNGGWVSDTFISDRNHKGLDIAAPEGTEIYAADEGLVVSSGWNSGGYGNVVMIEHPNGYATVYAHMVMTHAQEGEYVSKGQLVGFVGNTGNSFGDHCHFEVRYQGICLDPAEFLNTSDMVRED